MVSLENEIQFIYDKITQEIRINRAIRAEIESVFRKNDLDFIFSFEETENYQRKINFIDELFEKFENTKLKVNNGDLVEIGEVSALLKSIEIEEKYLLDRYYKSKAHCTLSYFASKLISMPNPSLNASKKSKPLIWCLQILLLIFILYIFLALI
jgi:HD superfamily phosphohydrolase